MTHHRLSMISLATIPVLWVALAATAGDPPAPAPRLSITVGVEDGRYVARSVWCAYAGSTPDEAIGGLVRLFDLPLGVQLRATPAAVAKMAGEPRLPDFSAFESPPTGRRPQIAPE